MFALIFLLSILIVASLFIFEIKSRIDFAKLPKRDEKGRLILIKRHVSNHHVTLYFREEPALKDLDLLEPHLQFVCFNSGKFATYAIFRKWGREPNFTTTGEYIYPEKDLRN